MGILDILAMQGASPWDEIPRDEYGNPLRLPGMPGIPGIPRPQQQRPATTPQPAAMPAPQQGGWKQKLGAAFEGAIAAGATPNVAMGGPTDILRAMQAGGENARNRTLLDYNMRRQGAQDDLQRRKVESDIAENQAQAEYRKHLAESERNRFKILPNGTVIDTYTGALTQQAKPLAEKIKEYVDAGFSPEQARELAATGKLSPAAKPVPEPRPVLVPPGSTAVDANGKVLFTAPPATQRPLVIPRGGKAVGPDGKEIGSNPFTPATPSGRGRSAATTNPPARKQAPSATFAKIEGDKVAALAKVKADADAGKITRQQEQQAKQQIQTDYESRIQAAGGSVAPPAPTGNPAAAPVAAPPKAVTDRLPPGEHTFANGQTWRKNPDGTVVFVK